MNQKNGRTDPGPLRERARSLFISQATIDETLEWATPRQLAAIDRMLATELANREASKRARLMRQARFPVPKSLDGYDFANVRLPDGYTKEQPAGLDFAAKAQDLVFYGKTGRGKTHLATALGMLAVERGRSVRFRQTAELVLQLGKAKRDGALDSLLKDLARADLIILDEFGYVPFDIDGARLLYQIIAGSYERRSIILHHEHRVRQMGDDLRRRQTRRRDHRPHRPPRTPHRIHRPQPTRQPGPHVRQDGQPVKQTTGRHSSCRKPKKISDETRNTDLTKNTTMRYVHRWREANRGVPDREGYVRLEWAAGSMQVDFGVARARIAGEMADVHCLVVSLPYSNMRLCVALPGENAECLCHGLMLVFEHIGGVPPVIVMDNATGAGRRNAKGEVALTGVFSAFVAHYRLEVRFCNPYSGNEKGSVENAVGFLRRNLMVPPMRAESYGQLSRLLLERCDGLARDSYCPRLPDVPVAEVFDEERAALMPLPSTAFDPVRWESRTADKYGLVDIDSNRYLAGPDSARSKVLAAIRWDTVTLASPATGELLAEYPRQYGRSRNVEDPALVLPRLAVKPRAWRESSIRPDVPDDIRAWLDSMDEKTLRESLKAIGDACRAAGFDPAMQACGEILRSNRDMGLHADSLTPIALRMRDGEWEYPGGIEEPDLSGYDRFITGTDDGGEER